MIINFEQKKRSYILHYVVVWSGDSSVNVTGQLGFTSCSLLPCLDSSRVQLLLFPVDTGSSWDGER